MDVTFSKYQDWDPLKSEQTGEATAEIVHLAPDRVEFRWKQANFDQEVQHEWGCEFRLHNGGWIRHMPPKQ